MLEQIALETASILILCAFIFSSQLYITKILLKNVNARITQLDSNLAEAIKNVIDSKIGENFDAPNPLVGIIGEILKNNLNKPDIPRSGDGKFTIVEEIK